MRLLNAASTRVAAATLGASSFGKKLWLVVCSHDTFSPGPARPPTLCVRQLAHPGAAAGRAAGRARSRPSPFTVV